MIRGNQFSNSLRELETTVFNLRLKMYHFQSQTVYAIFCVTPQRGYYRKTPCLGNLGFRGKQFFERPPGYIINVVSNFLCTPFGLGSPIYLFQTRIEAFPLSTIMFDLEQQQPVKTPPHMIIYRDYFIMIMCAFVSILVVVFCYDMYCAYYLTLGK